VDGATASRPFTEHRDGSSWTYVPPTPPAGADSTRSRPSPPTTCGRWGRPRIACLSSIKWPADPPTPSIPSGQLGVAAIAANDVWAVGTSNNAETVTSTGTASQWTRIASPNDGAYINGALTAVSATSSGNVWAVGYYHTVCCLPRLHNNVLGRRGVALYNQPYERRRPRSGWNLPAGVSANADGSVWMVGRNLQSSAGSTAVAMSYDGDSWTMTTPLTQATQHQPFTPWLPPTARAMCGCRYSRMKRNTATPTHRALRRPLPTATPAPANTHRHAYRLHTTGSVVPSSRALRARLSCL